MANLEGRRSLTRNPALFYPSQGLCCKKWRGDREMGSHFHRLPISSSNVEVTFKKILEFYFEELLFVF